MMDSPGPGLLIMYEPPWTACYALLLQVRAGGQVFGNPRNDEQNVTE
jgi:hypothetical protein